MLHRAVQTAPDSVAPVLIIAGLILFGVGVIVGHLITVPRSNGGGGWWRRRRPLPPSSPPPSHGGGWEPPVWIRDVEDFLREHAHAGVR